MELAPYLVSIIPIFCIIEFLTVWTLTLLTLTCILVY